MKLIGFFKAMIFVTVVSLLYIHLQMRIFDLAYQGKVKEKQIKNLMDENGQVTYAILKLKSSQNLGGKLLSDNSDFRFISQNNVVVLKSTETVPLRTDLAMMRETQEKANLLTWLFGLKAQAETSR